MSSATKTPAVDAVTLAVMSKRLEGIAAKMQNTLLRTARSGVINTGRDFSCCILSADAQLLAVAESLPIHVMAGPDLMAEWMKRLHPVLAPGDAFLHNSPYHGCSHAADLSVLVPVVDDEGRHRFTVLAKAHQADIGNAIPTTYHAAARDVYEEGALLFPATKVQTGYHDIEDIIRICELRIRVPEQWRGDYLASLGAARVGERELRALGHEIGWGRLDAIIAAWFDYSERVMRMAIARLPNGSAGGGLHT
jgi:N-methylhydantoinase B